MKTPGLKVEEVFKRVRANVQKKSKNKQVPWDASSLTGDFFFNLSSSSALVIPRDDALPDKPSSGSFSLTDLDAQADEEESIRKAWQQKQGEMNTAVKQVRRYERRNVSHSLKIEAWRRFLNAFSEDNPYSSEDDDLRNEAQNQIANWQAQQAHKETEIKKLKHTKLADMITSFNLDIPIIQPDERLLKMIEGSYEEKEIASKSLIESLGPKVTFAFTQRDSFFFYWKGKILSVSNYNEVRNLLSNLKKQKTKLFALMMNWGSEAPNNAEIIPDILLGEPVYAMEMLDENGEPFQIYANPDGVRMRQSNGQFLEKTYQPDEALKQIRQEQYKYNGIAIDPSTGLMWQYKADSIEREWSDAKIYCNNLNLAGYSDWVLPRIEILKDMIGRETIFDPLNRSKYFWSSLDKGENAWGVYFLGEFEDEYPKSSKSYTRCVRGDQELFLGTIEKIKEKETLSDISTGLMWKKKPNSQKSNWEDANLYCRNLKIGLYSDWELPNKEILLNVFNCKEIFEDLTELPFICTPEQFSLQNYFNPNYFYWTSSDTVGNRGDESEDLLELIFTDSDLTDAYVVSINNGVNIHSKNENFYSTCVREISASEGQ